MKTAALESIEQLEGIRNGKGISIIFKHNTSCPISKNTRANFEQNLALLPENTGVYFLGLLTFREKSDAIAEQFNVKHESPQILVIQDGECMFNQSLYDISAENAAEAIGSKQEIKPRSAGSEA